MDGRKCKMATDNDDRKPEGSAELSLGELEGAAGGYVLRQEGDYGSFPYATVDDKTGRILTDVNTLDLAKETARLQGVSDELISQAQHEQIFGKKR